MAGGPDTRRMDAWRSFLRAHRALLDALEEELRRDRNLPLSWFDVLAQLAKAPENRLRMTELAASVMLSPSGITRLTDRMEAAGLVERQRCPADRRVWNVALTGEGLDRLRAATPVHLQGVQEHFGRHISDDEAEVLCQTLQRLVECVRHRGHEEAGNSC